LNMGRAKVGQAGVELFPTNRNRFICITGEY
jgi:hypothetical protein